MEIQASTKGYREADVQALAVAVFKDEKANEGLLRELDEATGGIIAAAVEAEELKGKEGETFYLPLAAASGKLKAKRLLLVGVGAREDYRPAQVSQMAGTAVRALRARH
ncbi:MAG TPA: M17 family peptidase N-terminal domain-containing protein, partial [Pyrinomonadaceae bacterium]|nr:M17 family peptidase N-terminal domain-containing protein [Pyrinomonadaceae bacterium]